MSKVIWKDIPNYKGLYQASNDGRIRSFYKKEPKELKQRLSNAGYFRVQLFKNKKGKWISVHRLIGITFLDNPENKPEINHKDENKYNNCVENLEWCTRKENNNYGTRLERFKKNMNYSKRKINNENQIKKCSKPIYQYLKNGTFIQSWNSISECSRVTGLNISSISSVCCKKRNSLFGFVFEFKESEVLTY